MTPLQRVVLFAVAAAGLSALATTLPAQNSTSVPLPLRGPTPLDEIAPAPRMTPMRNTSEKEVRNYPEQPPVIPHTIEGYQVDLNGNKCLSCHARSRTGESQAPMISITHFMDRDGQFLATISPRRFFCTACHVPQHEAKVPVPNDFIDIDTLLARSAPGGVRR
jgi:cytochrome c-type protein NapB